MKILIGLDSSANDDDVFGSAQLIDDDGNLVEDVEVEVRDYARGNTADDGGALYQLIET